MFFLCFVLGFMLFLGHQGHCSDSCVIGNVKKYVLDKVVINSCNLEKVDEDVFRAVCECCLLLQKWGYSSTKDKVSEKKFSLAVYLLNFTC